MRENPQLDITNGYFTKGQPDHFNASEVTPSVLCTFFYHSLLSTANSQIGPLRVIMRHLESDIEDGCSAADHCRALMLFSFSADSIIGEFFAPDRLRDLESDLRSNNQTVGQPGSY